MAAITAAVLGGVALGLQVHGMEQQKAGQRENKRQTEKANKISQASNAVDRAKARRRAIAASRIAQAQNEAAATQQGVGADSSQIRGAQSSILSTLSGNIAMDNRRANTAQSVFLARQEGINAINKANNTADTFNALASAAKIGGEIYDKYRTPGNKPDKNPDNKPKNEYGFK